MAGSACLEVAVVCGIIVLFVVAGAMLDPVSMLVISVTFVFPIITAMGYDPVKIGIMATVMVETAVVTPPLGFNCYVVAGAADVDSSIVFWGVIPYIIVMLMLVVLVLIFPQLSAFLRRGC